MLAPILLALALSAPSPARAELDWKTDLPAALKEAKKDKKLVLVDFQAPWCYSCYYMEKHALASQQFAFAAEPLVLVKVDVDSEAGHEIRDKYAVTMLPTYVLVDAKGREKGRIFGEQTENDFMDRLIALERGGESGQDELKKRLERVKGGDLGALEKELDAPVTCETAYFIDYGEPWLEKAKPERKARVLQAEKTALETLVSKKIFVDKDKRCADFRTAVEMLADVDEKLGLAKERKELLSRAAETMLSEAQTGEDRNRDDNVRFFLTLLDDEPRLRTFYKELIAAYPSDYVYSYRYAKWLEEHGKTEDALAWIEEADKLCYGANRLQVTEVRAKILADLGRKDEAKELLLRDAKASRKTFPRESAHLKDLGEHL